MKNESAGFVDAFLFRYHGSSLLEILRAGALFRVYIATIVVIAAAFIMSIFISSDHFLSVISILTFLMASHIISVVLLFRGKYGFSLNNALIAYFISWYLYGWIYQHELVNSGVMFSLCAVFFIIAIAGLFGSFRVLLVTAFFIIVGLCVNVAVSVIMSSPGIIRLVSMQAISTVIALLFLCSIFSHIQKILSRVYTTSEDELEKNLELMKALESQIEERTEQLLREKNRLKERNNEYEIELKMACQIQKKLIPSKSPEDYIHIFYKPMKMVGGDFFDFLRFRGSDRIGIFVSDVAGHGVPAAFVTSMVKSFILQSGARRENPADLLYYLNDLLYNQTADNFITAFYGIFDPSRRHLIYASAGHNPPFLIYDDRVDMLGGSRSIPLAVFDNREINHLDIGIHNNEIFLPPGCAMLLYTDGLVEERNKDNAQFQHGPLNEALLESKKKGSGMFINSLFKSLVEFSGSESFYDDVCMIYLDI